MLAPQADGRFQGTASQQADLADQLRRLFDAAAGANRLYLKHGDVLGLADDLNGAQRHWSVGQYTAALASLVDPDRL